jgi:murein DD-endopeptidase MepM/ murein hydrolase activator NlpD
LSTVFFTRFKFYEIFLIFTNKKSGKSQEYRQNSSERNYKMDKKIKFSEQPARVKIIYAVVIAILTLTAITVAIVGVASNNKEPIEGTENPPVVEGNGSETENEGTENDGNKNEENTPEPPKAQTYVAPMVGSIAKGHSTEIPVFSTTLNEWRVHTGIDISAEEGSDVYAVSDGTVSAIFADPFHGRTIEITHTAGIVSVYSNLAADGIEVNVGDTVTSGDKIGVVGDTSLTELADEPHLHFEMKLNGVSVNPLDYISEESKKASLGIEGGEEA